MKTNDPEFDRVREIAMALPGVMEGTIHGAPSWKLNGRLLTCPAIHKSAEPDTLRFRFIGDTDWSVQVLPEPGFRVPLLSEPTGVSRPLGFSRHFVVRGQPQPERA